MIGGGFWSIGFDGWIPALIAILVGGGGGGYLIKRRYKTKVKQKAGRGSSLAGHDQQIVSSSPGSNNVGGDQHNVTSGPVVVHGDQIVQHTTMVLTGSDGPTAKHFIEGLLVPGFEQESFDRLTQLSEFARPRLNNLGTPNVEMAATAMEVLRSAARTDRPADFEILTELLVVRSAGESNRARSAMDLAVNVVPQLDPGALQALTINWNLQRLDTWQLDSITALDAAFADLLELGPLPDVGSGLTAPWMDDLDMLKLINGGTKPQPVEVEGLIHNYIHRHFGDMKGAIVWMPSIQYGPDGEDGYNMVGPHQYPALQAVFAWEQSHSVEWQRLTPSGQAIAWANTRRAFPDLPPFEDYLEGRVPIASPASPPASPSI